MRAKGPWTRIAIGARAVLAGLLALGAAALAVELSDWRYARVDLTATRSNTLDPALLEVIDKLPAPVVVDAFLRPLKAPYDGVFRTAEERVLELLAVVRNARRSQVEVRVHDPSEFEAIQERQRELGTEGTNKLVITCGARRDELELFGELCTMDWGNPTDELARYLTAQGIPGVVDPRTWRPDPRAFRPALLQEFRGEELLAQALLKVSSGEAPRVYFARGHGEPALDGGEPTDLGRLRAALERDGFEVEEWDPLQSPAVPQGCDVLALIGAKQPFQLATRQSVEEWTNAGGRLVAAPDIGELHEGTVGGIVELLGGFGMSVRPGIVCQPLIGFGGEKIDGTEQCAWLVIDERGFQSGLPLTEPLRLHGRRVQFTFSPAFESGGFATETGTVLPVVSSPVDSWRDLLETTPAGPKYDFRFNPAKGERRDRHTLVALKQLRSVKAANGRVTQGRVLGVASAFFFDNQSLDVNRDFVLNAFNWLAEREYRLAVSPLRKSQSHLDFERSSAKPILTYALFLGLPGLCAGIALAVFLRRRS
jgi:hypothetical protein